MSDLPEKLSALAREIDEDWWEPKRQLLMVASVHLRAAEAQIESLQRENEGLIRKLKAIDAGHLAKSGVPSLLLLRELDEAKAAAITPEMREKMRRSLQWKNPDKPSWGEAIYMRGVIATLLGEQDA